MHKEIKNTKTSCSIKKVVQGKLHTFKICLALPRVPDMPDLQPMS